MQDGRDGEKAVKDDMELRHRNKGKQLFLAVESDMGDIKCERGETCMEAKVGVKSRSQIPGTIICC